MQKILQHGCGISLRDVLEECRVVGGDDIRTTSCVSSPTQCQPGDLFVALPGDELDGHEQAKYAIEQGASAIVAERYLPYGIPTCIVPDSRVAYGNICQALAGDPSQRVRVVGVTGTNGKTTTSTLIRSVLAAGQATVGTTNSIQYDDAATQIDAPATTPAPEAMAHWLARMDRNGCSHAVVEVDSQALVRRHLSGVQLDAAVLTNLRQDHLDLHGTVWNYRKAKKRIFDHLKPEGFAILNADDPGCQKILPRIDCPALTFGMHAEAELTATVVERQLSEQTCLITAGSDTIPLRTRMIGDHHIKNCLAAAAVGLMYGMDLPTIVRGLEAVQTISRRLERIECGQPFGVFVDYAHTPDTLAMSLKAIKQNTQGRVIVVCAVGSERTDLRPMIGRVLERNTDLAVLTSDDPACGEPLREFHQVLDGCQHPGRPHLIPSREKAITWALSEAEPGDTVLIAGKGHSVKETFEGETFVYDDRDITRGWLYDMAWNDAPVV